MGGEERKLVNGYLIFVSTICFDSLHVLRMHNSKGKTVHIVKQLLINCTEHHVLHILAKNKIDFYISLIDNYKFNTFLLTNGFRRLLTVMNAIALFLLCYRPSGMLQTATFCSIMVVYENLKFILNLVVYTKSKD